MTKLGKVLSVWVSLCLFLVLAVMPEQFYFGKNVYRQLPLYCFLEERAEAAPFYEDRETFEKIAAANGEYLGKIVKKEKQEEEARRLAAAFERENRKKVSEEAAQESENVMKRRLREKEASEKSTANDENQDSLEASVKPKPIIDLSPEMLADPDYLLSNFFIEDAATEAFPGLLNAPRFLEKDLTIRRSSAEPQILIYHSHASETFVDSRPGKESDTIVGVGAFLTKLLKEKYGYNVVHIKEVFDMAGGTLDRSSAYDYAREYLVPFLEKHPSVEVIIDMHRDGVPEDRRLVTEIDGKSTAQIMFYNGLCYTKAQGALDYLPNPYIDENLAFSFQMEYLSARYYPDFYRGIYLAGYRYNLHLRPRSMLLEVGAQTNTLREAKNAMEPFGALLDMVLRGGL